MNTTSKYAVVVRPLADGLWQVKCCGGILWRCYALGDVQQGDQVEVLERQGNHLLVQRVRSSPDKMPT